MRKLAYASGVALVMVVIGVCLLVGTIGWFAIGFGVLTDCTDNYDCSSTNCSPCAKTGLWLNFGGLAQQLLAGAGIGVLIRGVRTSDGGYLASRGAALVVSSVLIVVGTTWQAQRSYCQPGDPGHSDSYCSTGDAPEGQSGSVTEV